MNASPPEFTLVDCHVHYYRVFQAAEFIASAFANFRAEASRRGRGDAPAVLLLAEAAGESWFEEITALARRVGGAQAGGAALLATAEEESVLVQGQAGEAVFVIAGRQVVTSEGLEVLALCTRQLFPDGSPAAGVLEEIRAAGGLPVIPWGAGKWWGRRGLVAGKLLEDVRQRPLWCGDSGVRPGLWPRPALLRRAEGRGAGILCGSDPLPLPGEERRVGSFGSAVPRTLSRERPAEDLKRYLCEHPGGAEPYGEPAGLLRFLSSQLRLRTSPAFGVGKA